MSSRLQTVQTPVAHLVGPGVLKVINGHLAFTSKGRAPVRLDPRALRVLYCYGRINPSDQALALLLDAGTQVAWLTRAGHRCRGRMSALDKGGTPLRLLQHRLLADPERCLDLARHWVTGKIQSQRAATRHYQRQGKGSAKTALKRLSELQRGAAAARHLDSLRGFEGAASSVWFELFAKLLPEPWTFPERNSRPPKDPINALLSLGYTWLTTRAIALLEGRGFEVQLGALHEYRPGRPSLACDLVEAFRVPMVDRWVLHLCHARAVQPGDFREANGGVLLQPESFAKVLATWERFLAKGGWTGRLQGAVEDLATRLRRMGKAAGLTGREEESGDEPQATS